MEKRKICLVSAISIASVAALLSLLTVFSFFSSSDATNAEWMKNIDDDASLSSLAIPGSHDSGATKSIADVAGKCQDSSITQQLDFGVRYFDVRLGAYNDDLVVYHGFIAQDLSFKDINDAMVSFLDEHPSETILLSVKEEKAPVGSSRDFETLLKEEIASSASYYLFSDSLPDKLGDCRKKIVLMSRYENNSIGIDCYSGWLDPKEASSDNSFVLSSSDIYVQDHYKLNDSETKWSAIEDTLAEAKKESHELTINFTSGYLVSSFPPSYAPSIAKTINQKLLSSITSGDKGVFVMDFVTKDLVSTIVGAN
ncbi:MAG: phosphatidylinositol-specific phospholipase C [Bacilli bacterium]|jgi:1-phosphatidylinositol phosphodiesterase|nr:phosphatidylinositol-specific phospholipase C [Bacilli bacterium]MCH4210875.1 phosphatidylinositol-specific phospholipase C [Bacilli bacterium]MCH4228391.1 phosphatidylinositol-specific phospholipase C [Bacilli bacterium]MCH4277922.1 phosphatidylinositol-specific phospholipase C [Bacilli bacterium]MCI2054890.1 phosphatidylinositol-specific phospholipase C [Bacilli bacterium]